MTDLIDVPETIGTPAAPAAPAALSPFAAPTGPLVATPDGTRLAPSPTPPAAPTPEEPVADPTPVAAPQVAPSGPVLAADPGTNPVLGAQPDVPFLPVLPAVQVVDHQPRQDQQKPLPGTLPVDLAALQAPPKREPLVSWRRVVKTVFWLSVLGGLGTAGYYYGPELYERYRGEGEVLADTPAIEDQPPAPLAFPAPPAQPVVAAASFELVARGPDGPVEYAVTTDFASAATETFVRRPDAAELQILTIGDQALIRRTDDTTWFRSQRGGFPLPGQLTRQDWVRFVDELFPVDLRQTVSIDAAAAGEVAGVPTRHLRVSVPSAGLAPPPSIPTLDAAVQERSTPVVAGDAVTVSGDLVAPSAAGALVVDPAAPSTDLAAAPPLDPATAPAVDRAAAPTDPLAAPVDPAAAPADPAAPTALPPAGQPIAPNGQVTATAGPAGAPSITPPVTTIEVWIDDAGIVRQAIGADVFGVDRVTVSATMSEPWAPILPPEEMIRPLDAEAVVHLGL